MTSQGMMLRNMALVGATQSMALAPQHKPAFEAGVALLFTRWTALQLGVANEWGGPNSKDKALGIQQEVCDWFYGKKSHEMLDLADLLDQAISEDFCIQAEDDSPYQVARSLINMHNQVAAGDYSYVQALQASQPSAASASQRDPAAADEGASSSDEEEGGSEGEESGMEGEDGMDVDEQMPEAVPAAPQGPIVDEDGFELVQRKGGRKGRR